MWLHFRFNLVSQYVSYQMLHVCSMLGKPIISCNQGSLLLVSHLILLMVDQVLS